MVSKRRGKLMMIYFYLLFFLVIPNDFLIAYYDDEMDDEDVFEPLCDIDFDGDIDCDKFISFASTNCPGLGKNFEHSESLLHFSSVIPPVSTILDVTVSFIAGNIFIGGVFANNACLSAAKNFVLLL